jgi:hypothetical protein
MNELLCSASSAFMDGWLCLGLSLFPFGKQAGLTPSGPAYFL